MTGSLPTYVHYHTVQLTKLGSGALLAKLDLKSAYRMVPVHPLDQPLLGMKWEDSVLVDTCLPFGLHSAPKMFLARADAISWALYLLGVENFLHYLDDFLFVGPPASEQCLITLHTAIETCTILGFPVALLKVSGPVTVLTFLGIELNTVAWELRLPEEKLVRLQQLIASWLGQESQSLIGHLPHAATVVRPG